MSTAMLNIRVVSPRMLTLQQAADYVGIKAGKFPALCPVSPVSLPGSLRLYDVRDLDQWLDQVKAGGADPDDEIIALLDKRGR